MAKAAYYPQLSGGVGTGDLISGERGCQVVSLNDTQMLYDFGKIKTNVSVEEARLAEDQARVLVSLDQVALEVMLLSMSNAIRKLPRLPNSRFRALYELQKLPIYVPAPELAHRLIRFRRRLIWKLYNLT